MPGPAYRLSLALRDGTDFQGGIALSPDGKWLALPDGKWIAYATDESGRPEVFVQSYPPGKGKWPVSLEGGDQPSWRRDGRELCYIDAEKHLAAVEVNTSPTFRIGAATKLFRTTVPITGLADSRNNYVARADGRQFLISSMTTAARTNPLRVVLNWTTARTAH